MIEAAADKSTCGAYKKAPKGKGMPPKGCFSDLPGEQCLGRREIPCGLSRFMRGELS